MSTMFRARKNENVGSGGKIVRGRRVPDVRSPYARPPSSSAPPPEDYEKSPNRLVGLISPATRVISGAAKIISSVFFPDSPTSSSSFEDDDSDEEEDDVSSEGDRRFNQNGATLEVSKYPGNNIQPTKQRNENKLAIEQLLMQETFSRDEYDRFVKIMESRVVEYPATKEGGITNRNVYSDTANGNGFNSSSSRGPALFMPDITNAAVMEAKKWVEEKKLESTNVTEGESGSPVLMARSYMKFRTPMASPGIDHFGFQTPSPSHMHLLKEETPYESGVHALSPSKDLKRSYLAVDSCNSVDGPRKVRFKSGEDAAQLLSEINYSQKHDITSVAAEKRNDLGGAQLLSEINYSQKHDITSVAAEKRNDLGGAQITVEGGGSAHNAEDLVPELHNGPDQPAVIVNSDSRRSQEDHATEKEMNGLNDDIVANGFSLRENAESSVGPSNEAAPNLISNVKSEGSCELLSETMVEVPTNEEIDSTASGSLNNSKRFKDLLQTESESVSSPGKRRMSTRVVKPVIKDAGTYNNKRGRGKGK